MTQIVCYNIPLRRGLAKNEYTKCLLKARDTHSLGLNMIEQSKDTH